MNRMIATVPNYINHIALVLDASGSMASHRANVVKVADSQIAYLAQRSKELDQETRVTVYEFEGRAYNGRQNVRCLVYDKDVLRLPSIEKMYHIGGDTPLIDATIKAIRDLQETPELYGEHAFLLYVITDGQENSSTNRPHVLAEAIASLPDNWTIAAFVPNATGVHEAKQFGFGKDNVAIWDTSSAKGISEVGETVRRATETFMTGRSTGVRGYKNLFQLDVDNLTKSSVSKLAKLGPGQFRIYPVDTDIAIADFVENKTRRPYRLGEAYYQLTKPVKVQAAKQIAIYDKKNHTVYTGDNARDLIGLPKGFEVRVEPKAHKDYQIFIQSTSTNWKLFAGTYLLIIS